MDQEERLSELFRRAESLRATRASLRADLDRARREAGLKEDEALLLEQVSIVVRRLVDGELTEGVRTMETLQTEGIRSVFYDQDIRVRAEVEVVRGKVNVSLLTSYRKENGDLIEAPTLDAFGGAVATVQSVLLRLSLIFRRGMRPMLFLDESLPAFDDRYIHRMALFLKTLCERLGVDILVVTHNQSLLDAADRAYRIRSDGEKSSLHRIERK